MNKGFLLDGFPRSIDDAKAVFMDKIEIPRSGEEEPAEDEEPQYELKLNDKIVP